MPHKFHLYLIPFASCITPSICCSEINKHILMHCISLNIFYQILIVDTISTVSLLKSNAKWVKVTLPLNWNQMDTQHILLFFRLWLYNNKHWYLLRAALTLTFGLSNNSYSTSILSKLVSNSPAFKYFFIVDCSFLKISPQMLS